MESQEKNTGKRVNQTFQIFLDGGRPERRVALDAIGEKQSRSATSGVKESRGEASRKSLGRENQQLGGAS